MKIAPQLRAIEQRRRSRVLVLAASHLELELLPPLHDALREIGRADRLDLLVYCRGGVANAARRIALLLHQFTDRLAFIVPDRCESSGTLAALGAHEIVAGPAAIFSPVDPLLESGSGAASGGQPLAVHAEDVRLFAEMARDWFGLDEAEARARALTVLCESIFPTTLTSFYRSTLEMRAICLDLLSLHMSNEAEKARIADGLLFGHHSHTFALTREELRALGLPVRADAETEDLAWEAARALRGIIGAGARASEAEDWVDAVLATTGGALLRRRSPQGLSPVWERHEVE